MLGYSDIICINYMVLTYSKYIWLDAVTKRIFFIHNAYIVSESLSLLDCKHTSQLFADIIETLLNA